MTGQMIIGRNVEQYCQKMKKWCFLVMVFCVVDSGYQFPSNDKEIRRGSSREKIYDGAAFELCQNTLKQVTERLRTKEDIYKLLQGRGTQVNYETSLGKNWCMSVETSVQLSWHYGQDDCVNLKIFDSSWNFNEYFCNVSTEPFVPQREFADSTFDSASMIKKKSINKRALKSKFITSYVNLAREMEVTECSTPTLNVHFNEQLVFSNGTGVVGNGDPVDIIEVYINVASTPPGKHIFLSPYTSNYHNAERDCENRDMRLVTINSEEQTKDVVAAMNKSEIEIFWTGGEEFSYTGGWHWSEGEIIQYENWDINDPDVPEKSCIAILKNGKWDDRLCTENLYFICESTSDGIPPAVNIFVGENLTYQSSPDHESHVVEVKLGVNGDASEDHSTKVLLLKRNSTGGIVLEEKTVIPENFTEENFNGIDILIESIKQKGFSCRKEKTFHVHTEKKLNHANAREFCRNISTQLVSIQNAKQQLEIEKLMLKLNIDHYYWTSGFLAENRSSWLWNENEVVTYSNWATKEPNNLGGKENCIEMFVPWKTAKWNDQECLDENHIICESFLVPYWYREQDSEL